MHKIDSWWEHAIKHRRLSWMLCDNLDGWDMVGEGGPRGRGYGDICIADSLCYKAETNTPLLSNYTPIMMLNKQTNKQNAPQCSLQHYL